MEGISASLYTKMRMCWRRRGYVRINGSGHKRKMQQVQLGGEDPSRTGTRKKRFSWRIKTKPKIKFFTVPSPKKFFLWLRDSYVKMMLRWANSPTMIGATAFGGSLGGGFGKGPLKEYDEKMIVEIYKSLAARQGQLVPLPTQRDDVAWRKFGSVTRLAAIVE